MKKLLLLLLCILLLAGCTPAVYDGPTKTVWALQQMNTVFYDAIDDGSLTSARTTYAYDSYGNQVHSLYYTNDVLEWEYKYRFDDRGNIRSCVTWDHTGLIPYPRSRTSYTYDDQNRPLTTTRRNFFYIKTSSDTYTYDDAAGIITWDGTSGNLTQYLNEDGKPVRVVSFNKLNGTETQTFYEYDDLGRNIKIHDYHDGTLSATAELRYDDQDRLLEQTTRGPDGSTLLQSNHIYEENTVTTRYLDGSTTIEILRPNGQTEKREQYDAAGNLTSRTEYIYQEIQVPAKEE